MNITIPSVQTDDRNVNQLQSNINNSLAPLLNNPVLMGSILTSQALGIGSNTIVHKLNRQLQGWFIVRQRALANIYDTQDSNASPATYLLLTSDAAVTVDIYVF